MKQMIAFFLFFLPMAVIAQNREGRVHISGTVKDAAGNGIPNVTITEKGSKHTLITGSDGVFDGTVASRNTVLVFSSVGYAPQEVTVGDQQVLNVTLRLTAAALGDVVVVGYGAQRKVDITGAVATVKAKDFVQGATRDASELLRGKVAGLTISSPSGDPTGGGEIFLRGINTLTGDASPLILIDGVPGDLRTVAPEDIAQIDVLKDGSSAAIYGTRATNGVILITTKKPQAGATTIDYNSYVSTEQFVKTPRMLTADEFRSAYKANNLAFTDYGGSTNWLDKVTRTPVTQVQDLSIRGGTDKTNFLADLNYRGYQGMFKKSDDRTIIARIALNHSMFNDRLKLNLNYNSNNDRYDVTGDGYSFNTSIYNHALITNPTLPVYQSQVNPTVLASMPAYGGPWAQPDAFIAIPNPLSSVEEDGGVNTAQKNRVYGYLTYDPVSFLSFRGTFSSERYNQMRGYMESFNDFKTTVSHTRNGYASRGSTQSVDNLMELTGEFKQQWGDHHLEALAGYGYQSDVTEDFYEQNWNFPTDAFDWNNMALGRANSATKGQPIPIGSSKSSYNLISFFGRINYNFQDKYLFMASIRHEADSRFLGSTQPWGTFPAASVGWRINREDFLKDVKAVTDLKLRAGYGVTGVAPTAPYLADYRLAYSNNSNTFLYNGQWVNLLQPASNPNPDFTWERKHEFNLGLDFAIFDNRVAGSIDAYSRKITDLLYNYPVPIPPNTYNTTYANVGTIKNEGIEVLVNVEAIRSKSFDWHSTLTFSTNKNTMGQLNNNKYTLGSDYFTVGSAQNPIAGIPTNIVQVGKPLGEIYGWKAIDIDTAGKWVYLNAKNQRVSSGLATANDRRILGNGIPKYFAGWNNTFKYKQFDLGITMRGEFGFQIIDFTRMHLENFYSNLGSNVLKSAFDPVFGKRVLRDAISFNSYYVENGDFWKIDNVTLGWTWDPHLKKTVQSLRFYASVLNTWCFTKYKGLDPEISLIGNAGGLAAGTDDWYKYPTSRVYTLGVNLTLK